MPTHKPTPAQRDLLVSILHSKLAEVNHKIDGIRYAVIKPSRAEAWGWYTLTVNIALLLEQVCGEEDVRNEYVLSLDRFEELIKDL